MGCSVVIVDFSDFIVSLTLLIENLVEAIKGEKINENIWIYDYIQLLILQIDKKILNSLQISLHNK